MATPVASAGRGTNPIGSVISQFGWQFERQFLGKPGGLATLNESGILIGGLDQGAFVCRA